MTEYQSAIVERGRGGYGGPLTITPTAERNKIVYIVGGGAKPEIVDLLCELTGAEPVNGFATSVPDEQIAAAVIDCGGTLRCGIYPKKGIPTINVMPTGKTGPLAGHPCCSHHVRSTGRSGSGIAISCGVSVFDRGTTQVANDATHSEVNSHPPRRPSR